jgi:3,4-dihydroxy 2-butanone 4-phosphate synthase
MSIALMEMAGLTEVAVCCEMMDDNTGGSLPTKDAKKYAEDHDLVFMSGADLIKAYEEFQKNK